MELQQLGAKFKRRSLSYWTFGQRRSTMKPL